MNHSNAVRYATDDEIRFHYNQERNLREACEAVAWYGQQLDALGKIDRSYYVPIGESFRKTWSASLDHLNVHASALSLAYEAKTGGERTTYYLAAEELDRILDAYEEGKGNFSHRQLASSIQRDRYAADQILKDLMQDKSVIGFWRDHVRSAKTGKLPVGCDLELGDRIRTHFLKKVNAKEFFSQNLDEEAAQR